jgi:hypothetical protein
MISELRSRLPLDVWACALLIAVSGLVFLIEGLIRLGVEGGANILLPPGILCGLEVLAAAGVIAGLRYVRPPVLFIVILGTLWHLVVAMSHGSDWTRLVSGVLVAAQAYAFVLMYTGPVRAHFGLPR